MKKKLIKELIEEVRTLRQEISSQIKNEPKILAGGCNISVHDGMPIIHGVPN